MYVIDISKLQAGDIFLTTQKHIVSKAIKAFTSSDYSHAMLHVGDGSYIHSDGEGVHSGNVQRLLLKKENYLKVLRLESDIDRNLINTACIFARREVGKQYSVKDAINTKNPLSKKKGSNRQFCSRLVAQSYESAGINLVANSMYCSPEELDGSKLTITVLNCLREASTEEIEFANSENPIEKQANITNLIFEETRRITNKDIQTFEQLLDCLLIDPKYDNQITKIIKDSGYLVMWQHEMNATPWRYDEKIFLSLPIPKDELHNLATTELQSANNTKKRHVFMYEQFMNIWRVRKLEYTLINIMLYQQLIELTNQRISICTHVIKNT